MFNQDAVVCHRTMKLMQFKCNGKFGNRAFARAGPKVWNILPQRIRVESDQAKFKSALKTYLFDSFIDFSQKLIEH